MNKIIGIIYNPEKELARAHAAKLKKWFARKSCRVIALASSAATAPRLDCALALGGDGTMLKASRLLAANATPVLGVNLGTLGFLAETDPREVYSLLPSLLNDTYSVEEHMMLNARFTSGNKTVCHTALNDVILHSSSTGRVVSVTAKVDGDFLGEYVGDGIIVATPTGSTAYSLAANGPIVHPHLSVVIITPICPHTLAQRPLIMPSSSEITLALSAAKPDAAILSIDGQLQYRVRTTAIVRVSMSEKPLRLILNPRRKYLNVLREKLKWGERG